MLTIINFIEGLSFKNAISIATLGASVIGLGLIWFQLRVSANSSKSALLASINRDLNSYVDVAILIENPRSDNWVADLNEKERERLLDYISYFEGLYLFYRRGMFSLDEIDIYFGSRFFRVAHNRALQSEVIYNLDKYGASFRPVFGLHKTLTDYRKRKGRHIPDSAFSLEKSNPNVYRKMLVG